MIGNELTTIVTDINNNWLVSGQDLSCRSALLKAELFESAKEKYIHVLIAPEDYIPFISNITHENGLNVHGTLPTYTCSYFPVFTPDIYEERIFRFLHLLRLHGLSEAEINRANTYLDFICELERLCCNRIISLTYDLISKYSSISAVEQVVNDLLHRRVISDVQYRKLLEKYAEVSSVAPVIENLIGTFNSVFYLKRHREKRVALLNSGDIVFFSIKKNMDSLQRKHLLQMIAWDISDACNVGKPVVVSVLEGKKKYDDELTLLLEQLDGTARVSLYADDIFSGHAETWKEIVTGYFANNIYSYHRRMESCEEISNQCGNIPIVRSSYSYDRDRRLANNRLIDCLFDTNRVDHYVQHVPAWEPKFRKEDIHSMPPGTCLVITRFDEFYVDIN